MSHLETLRDKICRTMIHKGNTMKKQTSLSMFFAMLIVVSLAWRLP